MKADLRELYERKLATPFFREKKITILSGGGKQEAREFLNGLDTTKLNVIVTFQMVEKNAG